MVAACAAPGATARHAQDVTPDAPVREPSHGVREPEAANHGGSLSLTVENDFFTGSDNNRVSHAWNLRLGIVGPAAGGEGLQKGFHGLIGADDPQGWDPQWPNEPILNVDYTPTLQTSFANRAEAVLLGCFRPMFRRVPGSLLWCDSVADSLHGFQGRSVPQGASWGRLA